MSEPTARAPEPEFGAGFGAGFGTEFGAPPAAAGVVTVLLLSDHVAYRELLAACIGGRPELRLVGTVDQPDALFTVAAGPADIVLLDADSTTFDPVATIAAVGQRWPDTGVVALTRDDRPGVAVRLTRAGCTGLLTRTSSVDDILQAIRMAGRGVVFLSTTALSAVRERLATETASDGPGLRAATPRELEVLDLLVAGESTKEIAEHLHMSVHTCRAHVKRLMQKFNARTQLELVARVAAERRADGN